MSASLPRKKNCEPTPATSSTTAMRTASPLVTGAPVTSARIRQASRDTNTIATTNATSIEQMVSRPSKRWVRRRTGMRNSAGTGP